MKIGIDILDIEDLKKRLDRTPSLIDKLLSQEELKSLNIESVAGKIAAKEAIIKTGYLKVGEWLKVQIVNDAKGAPCVKNNLGTRIDSVNISISHIKQIAIAVAVYETD